MKLLTSTFLESHSLTDLYNKYSIKYKQHDYLPLIVLNYDNIKSPKEDPIVKECRGLILELNSWKCIGKGMNRFFNKENNNLNNSNTNLENNNLDNFNYLNFNLETKEDGTYILLFCYENEWVIATRHNFCNDNLNYFKKDFTKNEEEELPKTYKDLFELANNKISLQNLGTNYLNKNYTYCLELCSPFNKIIQNYEKPKIFLLSVIDLENNFIELSNEKLDEIVNFKMKDLWFRPKIIKNLNSMEMALNILNEMIEGKMINDISNNEIVDNEIVNNDNFDRLTFEGFVMKDNLGNRLKLKNPYYLLIHQLKYRSFIKAGPNILVPFILKNKNDELFKIMSQFYECKFEIEELQKRINYCKEILQKENKIVLNIWKEIYNLKDYNEMLLKIKNIKGKHFLLNLWRENQKEENTLQNTLQNNYENVLQNKWLNSPNIVIEQFFPTENYFQELFLDKKHLKHYCNLKINKKIVKQQNNKIDNNIYNNNIYKDYNNNEDNGLAKDKPYLDLKTNKYIVKCYCGNFMTLRRLKRDFVTFRKCHCNALFNYHTYKVGTLIYFCNNYPNCLLTHEAHQCNEIFKDEKIQYYEGQPLGIPCNEICKIYRLQIHEILQKLRNKNNWTKSQCYGIIAQLLEIERKKAHVALFDINTCKKVIQLLLEKYKVY